MIIISGETIRGYELGELIAEGGFGAVYRAIQTVVDRQVAIKVILPQFSSQPDFIRRFETEARLIARLEHPHIVPLYDFWRDPEGAYLVMRWFDGGSLRRELDEGPMGLARVSGLLRQVTGALAFAHIHGVIHRDVKPDNILLDKEKNAYLADFGIAKVVESGTALTQQGKFAGSPAYVAPEQARGEPVSPQTDIYSLGVVIFEALTGVHPFADANPAFQIIKHVSEPLPVLSERRPDLPGGLNDLVQRATAKSPLERHPSILELWEEFQTAIAGELGGEGRSLRAPIVGPVLNPYKGLRAFQEADRSTFFGREASISQLLDRLRETNEFYRFLAIVGPSGSGKSSLISAGLLPALRRGKLAGSEDWFIVQMQPGNSPLDELEVGLLGIAARPIAGLREQLDRDERGLLRASQLVLPSNEAQLLIVVDQFEEVFTHVKEDPLIRHFLDLIRAASTDPGSRVRIIITLRADFYDRPLLFPGFSELIRDRTFVIVPLSPEELASAIASPAHTAGVSLDADLVGEIVGEVHEQPGALPLLQYALTELFEAREQARITRKSYESIGGVLGALGKRSESIYASLDSPGQEFARQLFLRLITLGEGTEETRRRVARSEIRSLGQTPEIPEQVIEAFGTARLLTFDHDPVDRAPTIEIAHEALIREWERLQDWLNESRADVRLQRLLAGAVREWVEADRDEGFLLTGSRLDQFEGWAKRTELALTPAEQEYLQASLALREAGQAEDRARIAREARLEQRSRVFLRALAGALAVAAVVAIGFAGFARRAQSLAEKQAEALATQQVIAVAESAARGTQQAVAEAESLRAEGEAKQAFARELAAAALRSLDTDAQLGLLLALQAIEASPGGDQDALPEAEDALHRAVQANAPRLIQSFPGQDSRIYVLAYDPSGERLMTYGTSSGAAIWQTSGHTRIWDAQTGELLLTLPGFPPADSWPDESRLATIPQVAENGLSLVVWDAQTGDPISSHDFKLNIMAEDTENIGEVNWNARDIASIGLSPDFRRLSLAVSPGPYDVHVVWDLTSSEEVLRSQRTGIATLYSRVSAVSFSPNDELLAAGSAGGTLTLWDLNSGTLLFSDDSPEGTIRDIEFDSVGELIGVGISCSTLEIGRGLFCPGPMNPSAHFWEVASHLESVDRIRTTDEMWSVAFSPDGTLFAAGGTDGTAHVWEFESGLERFAFLGYRGSVTLVAFNADGSRLATAGLDGVVRMWDLHDRAGYELLRFGETTNLLAQTRPSIALSPQNEYLATSGIDRGVNIWNATSGQHLFALLGSTASIVDLEFSTDGDHLGTLDSVGVFRLWRLSNQVEEVAIPGFHGCCFAISPDARQLAISIGQTRIGVFDLAGLVPGEARMKVQLFTDVLDVAFGPEGTIVAALGELGSPRVFRSDSGERADRYVSVPESFSAFAFSNDGDRLAIFGSGGGGTVRDIPSGEVLATLASHSGPVYRVVFSEDDTRLATASQDGTVKIWDAGTGNELLSLLVATGGATDVAFSADGKRLYAAGADGVTRVYLLDLGELIELAESRLTRSLTTEECRRYLHVPECPSDP